VTSARIPARTAPPVKGFDPTWSRIVFIDDERIDDERSDGHRINNEGAHQRAEASPPLGEGEPAVETLGVHVLDTNPERVELTVVCVHGNPTWSYLWRNVARQAPPTVRVIAPDQVGMGFSARSGGIRRLDQRVRDLSAIVGSLDVRGPVVVLAHDWGGPVALGWSENVMEDEDLPFRIAGVVLTNTAVHQPEHRGIPWVIAATRLPGIRGVMTRRTQGFVRATTRISRVDAETARAFRAPYPTASDRHAIDDFVADIPTGPDHPTSAVLEGIASRLDSLADVPTLLVWGMRDPVFSVRYLDDLRRRLPHALVQQYPDAGHLVLEDRTDAIADIWSWIVRVPASLDGREKDTDSDLVHAHEATEDDLGKNLRRRGRGSAYAAVAMSEPRPGADPGASPATSPAASPKSDLFRDVSWGALEGRVAELADAFARRGVSAGDRVSVLIPPGADLLAVVYAVWRIGASIVVIDAAHGARSLLRSLKGARVDHVVAVRRAAPVVRLLNVPGEVFWQHRLAGLLDAEAQPRGVAAAHVAHSDAAIVFTSGATGPAKAVAYSRAGIAATRDTLLGHYEFTDDDVLVAAFAPWAVLGPLLGISSVIPAMDASRPGSLTAESLSAAMEHAGGTVMWMSPAALSSVLSGARPGSPARTRLARAGSSLGLLLLAGAPIARSLLRDVMDLWPECDVRTPYGMTEVLPATDVTAREVLAEPPGAGVLVGRPLPSVEIAVAVVDSDGTPSSELSTETGVLGEVALRAPHLKDRYDAQAFVEQRTSRNRGWHRTGDVGVLDEQGRLWLEGRLGHVITTVNGPVGPVSIEQRIEEGLGGVGADRIVTAAVGVGPAGAQVLVVVCAPAVVGAGAPRMRQRHVDLAEMPLATRVRAIARDAQVPDVAAVLWIDRMPVDIRHGAKIDRARLAADAERLLAGHG
jgi:acyl-coenzyme A synthetase/AMP-(fatty) acid ligase/pimeloyl-ACP methyl ester carboxylesterase